MSELSSGAVTICTITSKWTRGRGEGGVLACVSVCVSAKYFLHYTANPISSFRKLCNVNSRAPFIEQPGQCLPRTPILLTASKMHTEGLSLPQECTLASLPPYIQNAAASSSGSSHAGELACSKIGGNSKHKMRLILIAVSIQAASKASSCAE